MREQFINPASVLLLIRERQATHLSAIFHSIIGEDREKIRPISRSRLMHELRRSLRELESVGLIQSAEDGTYSTTPLLGSVQSALNLSLTELSERGSDSIVVSPIFGDGTARFPVPDVFVLMPFSEELRPVYEDHIRKVSESKNLSVARADDFFTTESIVSDIWKAIYNCSVVVADCTGRNANVFYEIGVAHTVGKPTILIAQSIDDVPFDLRHLRCIVYKYTPRGMALFDDALGRTLTIETDNIRLRRSG